MGIYRQQGNIIFEDTIVDDAFVSFSHTFQLSDTMNVTVYLRNDSAILPGGNIVNCLFEDQIYWETGVYPSGTPWGRWEFITGDYSNPGVDLNVVLAVGIKNYTPTNRFVDGRIYDLLGRELKETPIGQMYIQNGKKYIKFNNQ